MGDERARPVMRWGEELRRRREARRTGRIRLWVVVVAALAAGAALATAAWRPGPLLLWNATASSPVGLYIIGSSEGIEPGGSAVAWAPEPARRLAAERRYLPLNVPLVKEVGAAAGDRVCAAGEALWVNGELAGHRRNRDEAGRPLPWWTGCVDLSPGEVLLLARHNPASFDGRYFGPVGGRNVVGSARLLWAF